MEQLRNDHTTDADRKLIELDDTHVPALLRKGWDLAGQWGAAYLEAHPMASRLGGNVRWIRACAAGRKVPVW